MSLFGSFLESQCSSEMSGDSSVTIVCCISSEVGDSLTTLVSRPPPHNRARGYTFRSDSIGELLRCMNRGQT